jgi:hypothetical protein
MPVPISEEDDYVFRGRRLNPAEKILAPHDSSRGIALVPPALNEAAQVVKTTRRVRPAIQVHENVQSVLGDAPIGFSPTKDSGVELGPYVDITTRFIFWVPTPNQVLVPPPQVGFDYPYLIPLENPVFLALSTFLIGCTGEGLWGNLNEPIRREDDRNLLAVDLTATPEFRNRAVPARDPEHVAEEYDAVEKGCLQQVPELVVAIFTLARRQNLLAAEGSADDVLLAEKFGTQTAIQAHALHRLPPAT